MVNLNNKFGPTTFTTILALIHHYVRGITTHSSLGFCSSMVVHLGVFMNEMTSKIFLALGQNVYGLGFARTISLLGDSGQQQQQRSSRLVVAHIWTPPNYHHV